MKTFVTKKSNGEYAPEIFAPDLESAKKVLKQLQERIDPSIQIVGELLEMKNELDSRQILHD